MLNSIDVLNDRGETLTLPILEVIGGYLVKLVDGLDPTKATLSTSSFAQLDGVKFHSSRTEPRSIQIQVYLLPDYVTESTQSLRRNLYRYLMPETRVKLTFNFVEGAGAPISIEGVVEDANTSLFSEEPMMAFDIFCEDPDFIDEALVIVNGKSNASGVVGSPIVVDYQGTTEAGYELVIKASRTLSGFDLIHTVGLSTEKLTYSGTVTAGDDVFITTFPGFRTVSVSSTSGSVMHQIAPFSVWPQLKQGLNTVEIVTPGSAVNTELYYRTRYGGI